jgi:putative restriction endonuclease
MDVESYSKKFRTLKVNRGGGHASPHQPCMLLAVVELFESGLVESNTIYFDDVLLTRYATYFNLVRTDQDHLNPWMPFFHLKSDGFWTPAPLPGKEAALGAMSTAVKKSDITDNVAYVQLAEDLFKLLQNPVDRDVLRESLLLHWFPNHITKLAELIGITEYEKALRGGDAQKSLDGLITPVRSSAFRRLVIEAYDFRCAANGWRIILPDYSVLVEAAHIIPFSETADDRPQNGIALTPTFHTALDRNLIAPGPDMKWHVSRELDDRLPDNGPILEINGRGLILPKESAMQPDKEALAWRLERLI